MTQQKRYIGLTDSEVAHNRATGGINVLTPPRRRSAWAQFMDQLRTPLIVILMVAGVLSVGISCYEYFALGQSWRVFFEPIGIFTAILLATTLAFAFEYRANRAFRILNAVNDDEPVQVIRARGVTAIPCRDVVTGDIVILNTGDEIPADGVLLESVAMSVDESSLTGEPLCHKSTDPADADPDATYHTDHVMRGTKVMDGHGVIRVTAVGDATEAGKVYREAQIDSSVKTPLNEQLDVLGRLITVASYIIAALIIIGQIINFLGCGHWQSWLPVVPVAAFFGLVVRKFPTWGKTTCGAVIAVAFVLFFGTVVLAFDLLTPEADQTQWSLLLSHTLRTLMVAVTLIVVAVPEGLPMAVTLSLAYSMSRMLRTNNLVRRMHACETMGATTVICTDKTGTLTQNRMEVAKMDTFGNVTQSILFECIAVNSTAQLQTDGKKVTVLGNPTEGALLMWLRGHGADYVQLRVGAERIAEIPFSTERKYMATLVQSGSGRRMLYVKGAPEIILAMCSVLPAGVTRSQLYRLLAGYQQQAMRTLAFAALTIHDDSNPIADGTLTLHNLQLLGIAAIADPVRPDVPAAVREVLDAGIKIKIVTGDTPGTAREIGRRIGLWNDATDTDTNIITGPEFAALTDAELRDRVESLKIIARARPMDKKRLVEALQAHGEVVAVTGDGTNDAPALKTAQVGLSMGDGTSVAKEASDITIVDNSFSSIGRAVMWGRSLYRNIQRFLLFQLTVNVAACLLVLVGSLMGTESPLTVTQMLWVNLIMDTFGAMALASLPPTHDVMAESPRNRRASIITRSMAAELFGVGVFFFALTLGFYWIFCHTDVTSIPQMFSQAIPALLHGHIEPTQHMTDCEATLLFSIFVWTHFWYMFVARAYATGHSIFRLHNGTGFLTIVGVIIAGQLLITEVGWEFFNVAPMLHTPAWHFNPTGTLDLLIIVAASSLVIWTREAWHLLHTQ